MNIQELDIIPSYYDLKQRFLDLLIANGAEKSDFKITWEKNPLQITIKASWDASTTAKMCFDTYRLESTFFLRWPSGPSGIFKNARWIEDYPVVNGTRTCRQPARIEGFARHIQSLALVYCT